jgi:glycosyltransferase involved in cell wall biosynthesis
MKLSIVTSYYNCSRYIEKQSNSILSQSYQNWEWIIADDFSSDDTHYKLIELQKKDNRIRLVKLKSKKEIWWNPQTYATGDIVCPIDGDDAILPKTFEKIVYYFNTFPDAVLLHFNANKYRDVFPKKDEEYLNNFIDNVYISKDNNSFLEGFEKLNPNRTGIFGYLRIFRNLPNLQFKVYEDKECCSSNDGQWILTLEEKGKTLTIPRTVYLAREHFDSESFRNWNIRGESNLIKDAKERRKNIILPSPRKIDYFDDIYEAAESAYLSKLNWENSKRKIGFFNFNYNAFQIQKLRTLFFDHDVYNEDIYGLDYLFVKINSFDTPESISKIIDLKLGSKNICFYCDNNHIHKNNKNGEDNLEKIRQTISKHFALYYLFQHNRAYIIINK